MKKILVFPKYTNPYQSLLYREFDENKNIQIKYLSEDISRFGGIVYAIALPLYLLKNRLAGFSIFHLHWVIFLPLSQNKVKLFLSFIYTICLLFFIKLLGYKLVWTIHNILPHSAVTINDTYITRLLCSISNAKIVHAEDTITTLQHMGCDIQRTTIIPHGNYIAAYENTVTKNEAREKMHIPQDAFVFLFFGEIKPYKGIDALLTAFTVIAQEHKHATLIIAGSIHDQKLKKSIDTYTFNLKKQVKLFLHYIETQEIQYFMHACDVVVYPFKQITTSGSVLLAVSFAKPIVYPEIGALKELPESIGFSYSPTDANGLLYSLKMAINTDTKLLQSKARKAYAYAQSLSWDSIGEKTLAVYTTI